jgi:signal transduction histidine kinase
MTEIRLSTKFMPAETAPPSEVERQRKLLAESPVIHGMLDAMLNYSVVLNMQRQAVLINKAFSDFLAEHGVTSPIGLRTGNLFGCTHSAESPGGCGTTESCRRCQSAAAIWQALQGNEAVKECRILSQKSGEDLDLRVRVQPFKYAGEDFLLMSMADISSEKRREVLEKLFFHDILNTAGGVQGLIALMQDCEPAEAKTYVPAAAKAADRVIDQILSQRDLAAAERGDLQPKLSEVSALELLNEIASIFLGHDVAKDKRIVVAGDCDDLKINTDKILISRVLGNLVKNALEAVSHGATVTLSCRKTGDGIVFVVHNPGHMPDDSRLQVFQRSFSTKGTGRGLGTYSIRLLTEKYLKGKVSFTTGPGGTEFRLEYPLEL